MSRRKQSKPQALRTDEESNEDNVDASEPLPVVSADADFENTDSNNGELAIETKIDSERSTPSTDLSDIADAESNGIDDKGSKVFACSYCPANFKGYTLLKEHEQEHADLMPYRCALCGKGFKHKRSQDRHKKWHSGVRKYKCSFCETAFFRSDHLKLHMKTHEISNYPFACVVCQRGFNSSVSLEAHTQTHTANMKPATSFYENPDLLLSTCSICNVRFSNSEELIKHLDNEHSTPCASKSPSVSRNSTLLICEFCKKSDFLSEEAYQLHLEIMHCNDERPATNGDVLCVTLDENSKSGESPKMMITCGFCPEAFSDIGLLQKHTLRKHTLRDLGNSSASRQQFENFPANNSSQQDPTYACVECGRVFESILSLHNHASTMHPDNNDNNNNHSNFSSSDNGDKNLHSDKNLHIISNGYHGNGYTDSSSSSPKIYQCGQCDSGMQSLKAFTAHMRQHVDNNKPRDVHCDFCGMMFASEAVRDAHLVGHYLQKECNYSCKNCNKSFSLPEELQKHLLDIHAIHLYRCSLCKDVFESRVDVQVHFAVAHSNEVVRYRCRSCNSAFASDDQFNVHLQVVHLQRALVNETGSVGQPYYCAICHKNFPNERDHVMAFHQTSLNHHRHGTAQPFVCQMCGESFAVEYLYDKHIDTVHRSQMNYYDFPVKTVVTTPPVMPNLHANMAAVNFGNAVMNGTTAAVVNAVVKCNICDEKCDNVAALAKHKLQHCKVQHSDTCSFCQQKIENVDQFYAHARMHTVHGVPISCIVCKQSLVSIVEMQAHAKYHLNFVTSSPPVTEMSNGKSVTDVSRQSTSTPNVVKCAECGVKFENDAELKTHLADDHGRVTTDATVTPKSYQCIKCQKFFGTETEIRDHVASHVMRDGVAHHCMLCKRVFDSPSKLQRHLIEHTFTGCPEYRCYLCHSVFTTSEPLQQHMLTKHGTDERPYECRLCEQKFFFAAELENHNLTLHNKAINQQYLQQLESSTKNVGASDNVVTPSCHSLDKKPNVVDAVFVCPQCGLVFNSVTTLKSHSAQCRRKLEANIIGDNYSTNHHHGNGVTTEGGNSRHKRTSRYDYKATTAASASSIFGTYPCPHCPKTFNSLSALQGHSHVHMNNSKVHQCHKCKKLFPTAAKLRNHQRQHNGDKPFPCEFCGRYFSRKDNLKVHMRIHYKNGTLSPSTTPLSFSDSLPTMVPQPSSTSDFCLRQALDFDVEHQDDGFMNVSDDKSDDLNESSAASMLFGREISHSLSSAGYNLRSLESIYSD